MKFNYTHVVIGSVMALMMSQLPVQAARGEVTETVSHLSGEITSIDVKQGIVHFKPQNSSNIREDIGYKINKNETRVTDSTDKKFMTIEDLYVGQLVTIDVVKGAENLVLKKIVAEPNAQVQVIENTQTVVTTTTTTTTQ